MARPHWAAALATIFVAAVLLVANLDGYHNQLFDKRDLAGEPPLINWAHGWPSTFTVRTSIYPLNGRYTGAPFTGPIGITSRWPFDDARVTAFWMGPLWYDIACIVVLLLGTAYAAQKMAHWCNPQNSYGLRTLFVATAMIAIGIAFGPALFADHRRFALNYVVLSVAGAAAALTLLSLGHITFRIVRRLRPHRPAVGHW
jgi:hypothetical protein